MGGEGAPTKRDLAHRIFLYRAYTRTPTKQKMAPSPEASEMLRNQA